MILYVQHADHDIIVVVVVVILRHAAVRSAVLVTILFLVYINHELSIETSSSSSSDYHYERYEIKQPFDHSHPGQQQQQQSQQHQSSSSSPFSTESAIMTSNGYFNLSCPFEMSRFSCAYMHRGTTKQETVHASMDYYRQRLDMIGEIYRRILEEATTSARTTTTNKRILMTGDSLLRQLFISIACNAHSIFSVPPHNNNNNNYTLIADIVIPWQDPWPIIYGPNKAPSIGGGIHGGFGAVYIRLVNGMEIHYVPHMGSNDPTTGETNIIQRLQQDIE